MTERTRSATSASRIVLPTAPKEEEVKLGSANTWGKNQLKLLGVDLFRKQTFDLNRILKVRESDWPDELRQRMSTSC
jgi:hypothetical protein